MLAAFIVSAVTLEKLNPPLSVTNPLYNSLAIDSLISPISSSKKVVTCAVAALLISSKLISPYLQFVLWWSITIFPKFYDNNTIGIITFTQKDFAETNTDTTCTEGIITNIINIIGVKVAVAISEVGKMNYKVSIRTGEDVDSSKIALMFGGGGHKNAAGLRINGFYEDVVEKLLKAVRDEIC